jgi:hypothetical protein
MKARTHRWIRVSKLSRFRPKQKPFSTNKAQFAVAFHDADARAASSKPALPRVQRFPGKTKRFPDTVAIDDEEDDAGSSKVAKPKKQYCLEKERWRCCR